MNVIFDIFVEQAFNEIFLLNMVKGIDTNQKNE